MSCGQITGEFLMRSELFYCIDIIKDRKTVAITELRIIIPIDDNKV